MKGMEMMLKAMGLDPDELQRQFGDVVRGVQEKFVLIQNQQQRIEVAQLAILENQKRLFDALHLENFNHGEIENTGPQFQLDYDGPVEHQHINGHG